MDSGSHRSVTFITIFQTRLLSGSVWEPHCTPTTSLHSPREAFGRKRMLVLALSASITYNTVVYWGQSGLRVPRENSSQNSVTINWQVPCTQLPRLPWFDSVSWGVTLNLQELAGHRASVCVRPPEETQRFRLQIRNCWSLGKDEKMAYNAESFLRDSVLSCWELVLGGSGYKQDMEPDHLCSNCCHPRQDTATPLSSVSSV